MRRTIKQKLRSSKGESLIEVLVSVLISSLAMLMLATAINIAANIVRSGKVAADAYYAKEAELAQGGGTSESQVTIASSDASVSQNVQVKYKKVDDLPGQVTAYSYQPKSS